ncbi:hypothetical protein P4S83_17905 [Aneurinibacillus thermoaerophilus]|uniref:hypothetical protein n=1 Tax=Aneurinibacillus thermoaerophilus TaxID=143495 RepID=UPI002E1D8492|nr:hypothetical protein [Aneurinibacillus thermoaerophilus]MED0765504.1 hypothetical protein [Aneurinibacillus thermoaerophilus]
MRSFYERGRTLVPREKLDTYVPGEVVIYQLSSEELEKYRALPVMKQKRPVGLPQRRKKV